MRVLDIGCGKQKAEPGAIGIDRTVGSAADVIWDLDQLPWPLEDNSFDRVHANHVIEHVQDAMRFMAEVHRVCAAGADVYMATPHFSSLNSYNDPTHVRHLTASSFNHLAGCDFPTFLGAPSRFEVVSVELTFEGNPLFDGLCRRLARWKLWRYERHLAWILPAVDLKGHLRAIK